MVVVLAEFGQSSLHVAAMCTHAPDKAFGVEKRLTNAREITSLAVATRMLLCRSWERVNAATFSAIHTMRHMPVQRATHRRESLKHVPMTTAHRH